MTLAMQPIGPDDKSPRQLDYGLIRKRLKEEFPHRAMCIAKDLDLNTARKLRMAINKGDFYATQRSVSAGGEISRVAVYGGYQLSDEEQSKARGQ